MKKIIKTYWENIGIRVSIITMILNFLLFVFKLLAGVLAHSEAMVADAVHSLSDVFSTIAVIIGLVIASKKADRSHPYGHERIESALAIVLAFTLFVTGVSIGYAGILTIIHNDVIRITGSMGSIALIAAIVSIIVKEGMFHYTMNTAKKIKSAAMMADAWHHRSDALSSIGSFIGIFASLLGFPILDPICSLIICIFIVISAGEIFMTAVSGLVDHACDEETQKDIEAAIIDTKEDIVINDLKTRMFGNKIYIDAEIAVDGNLTLNEVNIISENIHNTIEDKFESIKHLNIHTVPKKIKK